jgi:hypothetical protein
LINNPNYSKLAQVLDLIQKTPKKPPKPLEATEIKAFAPNFKPLAEQISKAMVWKLHSA